MAALSFDAAAAAFGGNSSPSFVFDIYDDGHGAVGGGAATAVASSTPAPSLPGGRCNFVDLTHGSGGAQCGCRRFWSRSNAASTPAASSNNNAFIHNGSLDLSQAGWCMCSHHACYHDHAPPTQAQTPSGVLGVPSGQTGGSLNGQAPPGTPLLPPGSSSGIFGGLPSSSTLLGQENERPRPSRAPLSPVQDPMAFQALTTQDSTRHMLDGLLVDSRSSRTGGSLLDMSFGLPATSSHVHTSSTGLVSLIPDGHNLSGAPGVPDAAGERPPRTNPGDAPAEPVSVATSIAGPSVDGSIPDTLSWGCYGPSPRDGQNTLPHCASASQGGVGSVNASIAQAQVSQQAPSSTSSSSQLRYLRPFGGKGLHTLTRALEPTPENQIAEIPAATHPEEDALTTQEASPRASMASGAGSLLRSSHHEPFQNISSAVRGHEMRLQRLENPSVSFIAGHEECQDRHDHADLRVTELESRMDDVEKRLNNDDASTVAGGSVVMTRRRLLGGDDDATTASVASGATDRDGDPNTSMVSISSHQRADMYSQLKALQAQVSALQSASLPSYDSPWELEVVYLPFPLKGVWIEASQFPTTSAVAAAAAAQRRQAGGGAASSYNDDEWTQLPNTLSRQTPDPQSPYVGMAGAGGAGWRADWSDPSMPTYAPRLLPRACAQGRNIDNRLKSRGLVKTLTVRGSDARSLQLAMAAAFGPVLEAVSFASSSSSPSRSQYALSRKSAHGVPPSDSLQAQFLGLQQPWIPLRKIHKDSRLRFLTRAEMLTPSLWDAAFLRSSVVMKATGIHRLYVTQPDAYLQDRHAYKNGWSWQRLRELGRISTKASFVDPSSSSASVDSRLGASSVDDDALDACWSWDSRLDEPEAVSPSVRHRQSPSPFSREVTPAGAAISPSDRARLSSHPPHTAPLPTNATVSANHRSHSSSGVSGSQQQFFTASQSPHHTSPPQPMSSVALQRSQSPFFFASSLSRPATSSSHHRPPPIRTTSMPIPAGHVRPLSSAGVARNARRVNSAGQQPSPASTAHPTNRHYLNMAGERRLSPLTTASRPSSRVTAVQSPVVQRNNTNNNNRATVATIPAGADRRRRSTRSPGAFWPRHTPGRSVGRSLGRSMSRSPSVPAGRLAGWPDGDTDQGHAGANWDDVHFCYATPYSNGPAMDPSAPGPPGSSSSRRRRHGSLVSSGNRRAGGYKNPDLPGYGSEDYDDYPMTQDDDEDDYDIQVYEDEPDELDTDDAHEIKQESPTGAHLQQINVPPEDEPWPGIEDDDDNDHNQQQDDVHMSDSENQGPSSSGDSTSDGMVEIEADHIDDDLIDNIASDHDLSQHSQHSVQSDASSKPSEYPTRHWAWQQAQLPSIPQAAGSLHMRAPMYGDIAGDEDSGVGFKIHEDGDVDLAGR